MSDSDFELEKSLEQTLRAENLEIGTARVLVNCVRTMRDQESDRLQRLGIYTNRKALSAQYALEWLLLVLNRLGNKEAT